MPRSETKERLRRSRGQATGGPAQVGEKETGEGGERCSRAAGATPCKVRTARVPGEAGAGGT